MMRALNFISGIPVSICLVGITIFCGYAAILLYGRIPADNVLDAGVYFAAGSALALFTALFAALSVAAFVNCLRPNDG